MRNIFLFALAAVSLAWVAATRGWAATVRADSSCVACHESAVGVPYLEHNLADWKKSPHAKAAITCEACHGGDATKTEKAAAHAGMLPSTDPKSRVYFTGIPETCGACHAAEAAAFRKSRHSAELKSSGRGPNCVTCHGSMANHVLAPRELEMTCTLCHRRPTQAYATLLSLDTAGQAIGRLSKKIDRASASGVDVRAQQESLARAKAAYRSAVVDWHTFKMEAVLKASQEAAKQANTASRDLELKEKLHD